MRPTTVFQSTPIRLVKTLVIVAVICVLTTSCAGLPQLTAADEPSEPPLTNPGWGGDEDPTLTTTGQPTTIAPADGSTTTPAPAPAVQDPAVANILAGYTSWTDPGLHVTDNRSLQSDQWFDEESPNGADLGRNAGAAA